MGRTTKWLHINLGSPFQQQQLNMAIIEWKGNKKSTYVTLGASNHTDEERQKHDYYATQDVAIDLLRTKYTIPTTVWECCAGGGSLSERLLSFGHNVLSTDLYDRGYDKCYDGVDFLTARWSQELPTEDVCILTNFPYALLNECINHAIEIVPTDETPIIALCKTITLESSGRYDAIFSKGYLHHVFQFVERLQCAKNGDFERYKATAVSYAWFVFKRRPCVAPTIQWLTRNDLPKQEVKHQGNIIKPSSVQLKLF